MPDKLESTFRYVLGISSLLLIAVGFLFTYNTPPLPSFHLEMLAIAGWGGLVLFIGLSVNQCKTKNPQTKTKLLLMTAVLGLPSLFIALDLVLRQYAYPMLGIATILIVLGGVATAHLGIYFGVKRPTGTLVLATWQRYLPLMLFIIGGVNAVFGLVQYLQIPVSAWIISELVVLGRSYGNLRQSNLYALLLAWTYLGALGLLHFRTRRQSIPNVEWLLWACGGVFLAGTLAISGSRSGGLFLWVTAFFGLLIPGLKRNQRALMLLVPVAHAMFWMALIALDRSEVLPFYSTLRTYGGKADFGGGDFSNSRFGLWLDVWTMFLQRPWSGHGFYRLNEALIGMAAPHTPILNFIHAHNLILHWLFEFGLLATGLWIAVVAAWLWTVRRALISPTGVWIAIGLALVALHNMLEHPWWHAHFFLPSAFAVGLLTGISIGPVKDESTVSAESAEPRRNIPLVIAGLLMVVLPIHASIDYRRIEPMYQSGPLLPPLPDRLETAYETVWFKHWVDQAVVGVLVPNPNTAAIQCRLGKKVSKFFLGPHAALMTALACVQAGEAAFAKTLVNAVSASEPDIVKQFSERLPNGDRSEFSKLLQNASSVPGPAQR